jgi:hypothetical protein
MYLLKLESVKLHPPLNGGSPISNATGMKKILNFAQTIPNTPVTPLNISEYIVTIIQNPLGFNWGMRRTIEMESPESCKQN